MMQRLLAALWVVDNLVPLMVFLAIMALGGFVQHLWPQAYIYATFTCIGVAAAVAVYVFFIIPLIVEDAKED
jgi:hypothetical protein